LAAILTVTESPLVAPVLFHLGPIPIAEPVVTTWCLIAGLTAASYAITRGLQLRPSRWQAVLEILVTTIEDQIAATMQTAGRPFVPLLGTLFIFLAFANVAGVVPGVKPPTASIETAAALALIVFLAVHVYGLRRRGLRAYLGSYAKPTIIMLPLNVLSEITRTFSLMVRLFGNMLSGEFVIATVLALAGLFVPVPLMALEILIGLIQAYIFTVLAAVFIGAGIGSIERG
jgi:F-type H+-transporting ATPase subunit a